MSDKWRDQFLFHWKEQNLSYYTKLIERFSYLNLQWDYEEAGHIIKLIFRSIWITMNTDLVSRTALQVAFQVLEWLRKSFLNPFFFYNRRILSRFLGAKKHLYKRLRRSVRWLVGMSPRCNYVENWLLRDCFDWRRRKRKRITSRFHYVAIPSRLGIRWSPCLIILWNACNDK
jgi:hypothetical protein